MTKNQVLNIGSDIKMIDLIKIFLLGDNENIELDIFEHNATAYDDPIFHLITIGSEELEPYYDRIIRCACEPPIESAATLEIHLAEPATANQILLKKCKCIENKHHNTNFTIGELYDVKINSPYIKTNCLWVSHYENIVPDKNGNFQVGMCKFKIEE